MIVPVELWSSMEGAVRPVYIETPKAEASIDAILETAFVYGQNDFQPSTVFCSVSVGDIICYDGKRYRVASLGFVEMTEDEYKTYIATPMMERILLGF